MTCSHSISPILLFAVQAQRNIGYMSDADSTSHTPNQSESLVMVGSIEMSATGQFHRIGIGFSYLTDASDGSVAITFDT